MAASFGPDQGASASKVRRSSKNLKAEAHRGPKCVKKTASGIWTVLRLEQKTEDSDVNVGGKDSGG